MNSSREGGHWKRWVILCLVPFYVTGCSRDSKPERVDATRPKLAATDIARVGEVVISGPAFEQEWRRRTGVRSKEELLQELIRFESLLARARAAGVDRDPEMVAAFNRLVVGKFQEDQLQQRGLDSMAVNGAEIEAWYQSHLDRFTTPQQMRAAVIHCRASAKASAEKRKEFRQQAEALWNQARNTNEAGFRQLALRHSDDQATRYAGGDIGWFTPGQSDSPWEPEVVRAASGLARPGDFAPLIETAQGFYIVTLLDARPETRRPLEQVRDGIEYQLRAERAERLGQEFFREMQAGLPIEINRTALEAIPDRALRASNNQPPASPR
jgi:hypothetical protein